MKDLLRIASLLDNSGQFHLSDKLFKIAQEQNTSNISPQYYGPSAAQKEREYFQQKLFDLKNSNTPEKFVENLFEFSEQNNIKNLVQAFDAYATAGASYNGNLINRDPVLRELYMRVRNTPQFIRKEELVNEIKMLSNPQGTMNNQAASMRAKMPTGQAYETFTQVINNSKSLQELERYKQEIFYYDTNKFDQNDKNALFSLIKEKETEITSSNQQETADNYNEFISLVQQEPLAGLETLRTEIQNNQYLTERQKTQLNNMIDTRITNRR